MSSLGLRNQHRAIQHYTGVTLIMAVAGMIYLTYQVITYSSGEDIAQAGILIGALGTVVSGILGFMGGVVIGRNTRDDAALVENEGGQDA